MVRADVLAAVLALALGYVLVEATATEPAAGSPADLVKTVLTGIDHRGIGVCPLSVQFTHEIYHNPHVDMETSGDTQLWQVWAVYDDEWVRLDMREVISDRALVAPERISQTVYDGATQYSKWVGSHELHQTSGLSESVAREVLSPASWLQIAVPLLDRRPLQDLQDFSLGGGDFEFAGRGDVGAFDCIVLRSLSENVDTAVWVAPTADYMVLRRERVRHAPGRKWVNREVYEVTQSVEVAVNRSLPTEVVGYWEFRKREGGDWTWGRVERVHVTRILEGSEIEDSFARQLMTVGDAVFLGEDGPPILHVGGDVTQLGEAMLRGTIPIELTDRPAWVGTGEGLSLPETPE